MLLLGAGVLWFRSVKLSESEKDLLLRIDAGQWRDIPTDDFHIVMHLIHLKLVELFKDTRMGYRFPRLTERGQAKVAGLKARRWVEERFSVEDE